MSALPLIGAFVALALPGPLGAKPVPVDWPAFLARQDLVWTTPPARWEDGAFTGNGRVGAMIFAEDEGRALVWQPGRTDVIDHRVHQEPILAKPRLPTGQLWLQFDGPLTAFETRLDLWNAELVATLATARGLRLGLQAPAI